MSKLTTMLGAAVSLTLAGAVQAHVGYGPPCSACHGGKTGRAAVTAAATTNATNDPGVTAGLPLFVASAGSKINLTSSVTNGGTNGDPYAIILSNLQSATTEKGTLNAANTLTFAADSSWTAQGSGTGAYASQGPLGWTGSATNFTYAMNINAATPPDYYLLNFTAAGSDSVGRWSQSQDFYLHIVAVPEPATMALIGLSAGLLLWRRRRMACVV